MKIKDLKSLPRKELEGRLTELKKELMKVNVQASVATPKSPGKIRYMKRTIARIVTLLNQKKAERKGGKQQA